jgi:bifunctional non-homologous end joining protein LigD
MTKEVRRSSPTPPELIELLRRLRERAVFDKADFIEPCRPLLARQPPAGRGWIHEIKHDGYRVMARRNDDGVRLLTRKGYNLAKRFPQVVAAITVLPVRSCLIDGEAVVCNETGLAVFDLIRGHRHDTAAVLCAFDLIELDGKDLRRAPIEERKRILATLLSHPHDGIAFNEHHTSDGALFFQQACRLGWEGTVSKRLGSSYRSGRADCWVKVKNPAAPAAKREADGDWG